MTEKLTVEEHKQAVTLGIKKRGDGLWGFKRKCSRSECDEFVDTCYCAETFDEAVVAAQQRSNYTCSRRCWLDSRSFVDYLVDHVIDNDMDLAEIAGTTDEEVDRILTSLKSPQKGSKWDTLANPTRKFVDAWMDSIQNDMDYEPDEDECSCEV